MKNSLEYSKADLRREQSKNFEVKTVKVIEFEEQKGNQMNGFQMRKITSYLNWYCLSDNVSFLSDLAKNIFFLVFINLIMMYLGVDSHGSIFFEVLESVGLYLLSNLGIFSHYSFTYIYYPYTLSFLLLRLWHKIMLNLLVPADP